ncbi:MAG: phosphodiester glycosidase family protein [Actinomycetes bacterium]
MARSLRWIQLVGMPTVVVVSAGALLGAPSDAATSTPCTMTVNIDRTSSVTYANGVERNVYKVKVSWADRSQTADVHRMVMPPKAEPRLVTKKLGALGNLKAQLESPKGKRGIAAVNGDFFYGYSIAGQRVYLPRNASVTRGKPVRLGPERTRVVGIDKDGNPYDSEVGADGTVAHGAKVFAIDSVNWHSIGDGGVAIYTPAWADVQDAKRPSGVVEWVVKKNKIVDVRTRQQTGKTVRPHTKVVAFGKIHAKVAKRAKVRSAALVAIKQSTAGGVQLQEAIGRGVSLLDGGEVALPCEGKWYQQRPRTTVGWDTNGNWMTLSLPGSSYDRNGYRIGGLGLAQEANVAKALGFVEASELDGGGSTTAMVRRSDGGWDRVDDKDSIWQRPVPNALVWVKPTK